MHVNLSILFYFFIILSVYLNQFKKKKTCEWPKAEIKRFTVSYTSFNRTYVNCNLKVNNLLESEYDVQLICCLIYAQVTYTFTLIYSTQSQVYSHKSHFLPFCQGSTAQGKIHSINPAHCHARKFSVMSNESSGLARSLPLRHSTLTQPWPSSDGQSLLFSEETCCIQN